jgi:hypothetical protein
LSRGSSAIWKFARWLAGGVVGFAVVGYLLGAALLVVETAYFLVAPFWCVTLVQQRLHDLSGFDFEISKSLNCDEAINVLVSKVGEPKKVLIFQFPPPDRDAIPTITSIGDGTIQISIPRVPFIYCRKDKWDTLVVKYDIGAVDHRFGEPDEC